ncbi:uncharacterized protein [Apostichopus japonicus]|uniref:uncharacterized protein n=1 Tax=Stichopus japonicus TaxID=307972 RepID=UPI003AB6C1B5
MSNIQNAISEMLKNIRNSTSSCTNESTQSVQNKKIAERPRPRESTNGSKNNGKDGGSKSPSSTSNDKNTKIKRPMNAFMVWAREYRTILSKGFPKESNSQISVRLGDIWSNLTNEEKKPFYDRADKLRRQHEKDYPDWVYQPNKKRRIATSLQAPQYPNQYIINASNHGIAPTDNRNVKILPRPIIVSSSEVGTTQSQVLVHAPQGDSTVYLLPREQMNQKEEISASRHTEWMQSSSNEAFQNTSAPMRTNQTAPSTNGMIQNGPAVPRQLTVATPANSVSIGANTLTHQVPTLQATGPIHTPTKGPATSFVEVSPLSADRFQTLLSQHPIASLIGQLSPECKTAQDGQLTVDRHPTGSRKMKPAASKPAKGNQISSAEPVMSTGFENTSWGYVTGPYPRLPISGYPSQTQNAVTSTPLMHHQQQQGCSLVQLPSPHQYIGPNHPGCSLHPYVHQVMASPMGAGAVYGPVVRPLRMRPDYSQPPPQLMLPAQRGVMMYASPRPIHPAFRTVEGFNQREAVGFPTQAGNVQSYPCKRNAENNDRNVHVDEGRRYVVENTQRMRNGNNSNNTAIKTNDNNNNIYNNNNHNNNNNNNKAKDNLVSESNSKSITGNTTSYTNNSILHNKRAPSEMVSDYAKNETKCHNNVNQTVQTSIKNDIKTQQQPTTSQDRQQLEAVRANGVKPGSRTETAPLPRNKSFLQTLGSPISSNDVAEQLAKLIRPPMQPYAVAKKTPSSQHSAPQPHQSTVYISQSAPEAQEKRQQKTDILSQCVEQVFSKPDMKQVEFVTKDQNSPMFQFVKPVVQISEGTGNKYRLVAMETVSPPTSQFESPVASNREQVSTNLSKSFQILEKDNFPRNIFQTSSGSSLSSDESPPNVKHQKPIDLSIVNATTGVSVVQHCDRLPEGCDRFLLNMDSKEILVNTQGWDVQRCGQMEHGPNLGDRKMLVQLRKAHDEMCKNHQS